ncbi:uncharacterized protein B0H64DRAFT_421345 [Chaetomium fimeti]|uniref:FAD-binding domain-containing protein n=1 Tax=Chaetomium fimeti TaxID=1854472 RepID=A0AAE0HNL0_9PEZI|nr:hypothetical protein B0H64DRAFT_421345 [Chaetomium fimeti]
MSEPCQLPVIIAGAGIVGLALAQALKKSGAPFCIYERDQNLHARFSGWGLSVNSEALRHCLPNSLFDRLDSIQVDPRQRPTSDIGTGFLNLETAQPWLTIPSSLRRRVDRGRLRELLATDIDVKWTKRVVSFKLTDSGVSVCFSDGTKVEGSVLVAADGSGSRVRRLLVGDRVGRLNPVPAHYLAVTVRLTEDTLNQLPHPVIFQGSHPATGYYMFFSTLSTPEVNGSRRTSNPYYEAQLDVSWLSEGPEDVVPRTNAARLARIKHMAAKDTGFHITLRKVIDDIPDDTQVSIVRLADWPTTSWDGFGGRVTLLGDAAHPMTMYRGEAANQGFTDAKNLAQQLALWHGGSKTRQEALTAYETEMAQRGREAVLLSRQACLDAHNLHKLTPNSPLIGKRNSPTRPC